MPVDDQPQGAGSDPSKRVHDEETFVPGMGGEAGGDPATPPGGVADFREFCRSLIEIGLVGADDLEDLAADSSEGVLGLSRALVQAGKLTAYQAAAVYQKKSRGLLIGNYVILDKIGQGGMGVVFKARHRRLGRVGALKILPPSFARDRTAVLRFRREVEAAGRLKHPNVVVAVDANEDRGVHFLVMEFVEGRDLDRVVRERGPLPVSQAIDYLTQAARGLEAAHAEGIVHRDIKPGNLMLDAVGTVRVLDLGLARIVDAANPFGQAAGGRLTESGMYMGTIDFMAPEQSEDSRRADHRADIYALGCTLHYLLTGQPPFDGATVLKRLMAHMERPAPSLRTRRPEVPATLEDVYQKMMAKRPDDRPATMTEVISLLESCKAAASAAATTIADAPKPRPELMVFDETPRKRPAPAKTKADPSIFARPKESEGMGINHELNLEDLIMDVRSDIKPEPLPAALGRPRQQDTIRRRQVISRTRQRPRRQLAAILLGIGALAVLGVVFARFVVFNADSPKTDAVASTDSDAPDQSAGNAKSDDVVAGGLKKAPVEEDFHTIFDGTSSQGWMLCDKKPLKPSQIQRDGLNPHGTGSYLVVFEEKLADFELDFDYKLDKGCNTGVFLRVSNLTDPIHTGIEVALDDTTEHGFSDSGAFYDLVAPEVNAQKPALQSNHMTIRAQGPDITVVLNGSAVSSIHLDEWTVPGKRPDGSDHKFSNIAIANLARSGNVGFQDLGGNCWFNQIRLRKLSPGSIATRVASAPRPTPPATAIPKESSLEPRDPSAVIAQARELRKAGKWPDALAQYDKAIAGRSNDARLLIERARLLASMNKAALADAEFEKAARLAPENPQLFVDAGWWAVAPYPPSLDPRVPIETSAAANPATLPPRSTSTAPRWRELPVGSRGFVDLGEVSKGATVAAYALNLIYSVSARDVVLKIGCDDSARFWLNGQQVLESQLSPADSHSVIVTLRTGRNVILAKVVNTAGAHSVSLRIADTPADFAFAYAESKNCNRALDAYKKAVTLEPNGVDPRLHEVVAVSLAQAGRWKEARGPFERFAALDPGDFNKQLLLSRCYLALRDYESYRRLCETAVARHGKTKNRGLANNVIWMTALIPDAVRNYAEVVEIGHKWMNTGKPDPGLFNTYGAVLYRAKQYQPSVGLLKRSIDAKKGKGIAHDWVFMAMALHKSKQPGDREALSQAKTLANDPSLPWEFRVELDALLEEAAQQLDLPAPL